ncbi:MAG: hypothetical protein ACP5T0_12590 [Verrucomicrobiia bacterium]
MAKIENIILSQAHNQKILDILLHIPHKQLLNFVSQFQNFPPIKNNNALREELEKWIRRDDCEFTEEQLRTLFKYSPHRNLFKLIDAEYFRENAANFSAMIGKELFEVMILISNKRDQLKDIVNCVNPATQNSVEEFKQDFSRYIKRFVAQPFDLPIGETETERTLALNSEILELKHHISRYESQISEQKKKKYDEVLHIKQNYDAEISKLTSQINEYKNNSALLEKKLAEYRANYESLQKQLDSLKTEFEAKVNSEAQRRFCELIKNVFPEYKQDNEIANSGADVIDEARKALDAQVEYDKLYGTRAEFEKRLRTLLEIRDSIHFVFKNSLNINPALGDIVKKVENEIKSLQDKLGIQSKQDRLSNVWGSLVALIEQDTSSEQLNKLWETAAYLNDIGLVTEDELKDIHRRIYARYQIMTVREPDKTRETGFSLIRCLKENLSSVVILDAHNIINDDELKRYFYSADHSQSRNNLVATVRKIAAERYNAQFKIVFDGSEYRMENVSPNIEIYYSGGVGEQRADNFIIDNIKNGRFILDGVRHFIVTDDFKLAGEVAMYNFIKVQLSLFEYILKELKVV